MSPKFKPGQIVCASFGENGTFEGRVSRSEFKVAGYWYYVDLEAIGAKLVPESDLYAAEGNGGHHPECWDRKAPCDCFTNPELKAYK